VFLLVEIALILLCVYWYTKDSRSVDILAEGRLFWYVLPPTFVAVVWFVVIPLLGRRAARRARVLARRGFGVIASVSMTHQTLSDLAVMRGDSEAPADNADQLSRYVTTLVETDRGLEIYDGDDEYYVLVRIDWEDLVGARCVSMLAGTGSATRNGIELAVASGSRTLSLHLLPLGTAVGGFSFLSRSYCTRLAEYFEQRSGSGRTE
jgi:hypothetical protein